MAVRGGERKVKKEREENEKHTEQKKKYDKRGRRETQEYLDG